MKKSHLANIVYTKDNGERSLRTIIPTSIPTTLIKAIDVSDMEREDAEAYAQLMQEYDQYVELHMSKLFSIEDWAQHVHNKQLTPKWRSFKPTNVLEQI